MSAVDTPVAPAPTSPLSALTSRLGDHFDKPNAVPAPQRQGDLFAIPDARVAKLTDRGQGLQDLWLALQMGAAAPQPSATPIVGSELPSPLWSESSLAAGASDAGLAVLLISADLEELIGLSDTILVMFDGMITAQLDPSTATPELLGTYMTGGNVEAVA